MRAVTRAALTYTVMHESRDAARQITPGCMKQIHGLIYDELSVDGVSVFAVNLVFTESSVSSLTRCASALDICTCMDQG